MIKRMLDGIRSCRRMIIAVLMARKYKDYLQNGEYVFGGTRSIIVKREKHNENNVLVFNGRTNIGSIVVLRVKKPKRSADFLGTILMVTTDNTVKIFDYEYKRLFSFFTSNTCFSSYLENVRKAQTVFPTPRIYYTDNARHRIMEEIIINNKITTEDLFLYLLEFYNNYYYKTKRHSIKAFPLEHSDKQITRKFLEYYMNKGLSRVEIPLYLQHGDLWKGNVFYNEEGLCFIDFDSLSYYVFFYDLAIFLFTEGYVYKNNLLIKKFLAGEYDSIFNMNFIKTDNRNNYISNELLFVCCIEEMIFRRFNSAKKHEMANNIIDYLRMIGIEI